MPEEKSPLQEEQEAESTEQSGLSPQKKAAIVILVLLVAGLWFGARWLIKNRIEITTDNAFVESSIHPVSSRINGSVIAVHVKDNQLVKKGEILLELDPADYRAATEKAEAAVGVAMNESSGDKSLVAAARASLQSAMARQEQASLDLKRAESLYSRDVIPKEQLDRLRTNRRVADAQLREGEERLRRAESIAGIDSAPGGKALIRQKQAELTESRLKLGYTRILSPVDGYVTRKGVESGATIQTGQALMAIVPVDSSWIMANYKESQLTHIKPGQKVSFKVDAYPGRRFKGQVESIMAGTGAAFSLLPPENATGNYVKVVQRIPVKILIDHKSDPDNHLRVGMSVIPTIKTGRTTRDVLKELSPFTR